MKGTSRGNATGNLNDIFHAYISVLSLRCQRRSKKSFSRETVSVAKARAEIYTLHSLHPIITAVGVSQLTNTIASEFFLHAKPFEIYSAKKHVRGF
jgi:hypothetical protein